MASSVRLTHTQIAEQRVLILFQSVQLQWQGNKAINSDAPGLFSIELIFNTVSIMWPNERQISNAIIFLSSYISVPTTKKIHVHC